MKQQNAKKLQNNEKSDQQGFYITMEDAKEIKFNLDVARKEISKNTDASCNAMKYYASIARILNKAKAKRTVTIIE